jgi:DNA-directed RNA polymerase subunit RPC12/RpoP
MQVTFAGASHTEQRQFCCQACGHRATAEVIGLGEGVQSFLNPRGTARRRAKRDAVVDVDRTLSVATCPRCGHRDARAVRRWWAKALLPHAIGFVVVAASGWIPLVFGLNMRERDKWLAGWIMTGIACFVALLMLPSVFIKWSTVKQGVRFSEGPEPQRPQ